MTRPGEFVTGHRRRLAIDDRDVDVRPSPEIDRVVRIPIDSWPGITPGRVECPTGDVEREAVRALRGGARQREDRLASERVVADPRVPVLIRALRDAGHERRRRRLRPGGRCERSRSGPAATPGVELRVAKVLSGCLVIDSDL